MWDHSVTNRFTSGSFSAPPLCTGSIKGSQPSRLHEYTRCVRPVNMSWMLFASLSACCWSRGVTPSSWKWSCSATISAAFSRRSTCSPAACSPAAFSTRVLTSPEMSSSAVLRTEFIRFTNFRPVMSCSLVYFSIESRIFCSVRIWSSKMFFSFPSTFHSQSYCACAISRKCSSSCEFAFSNFFERPVKVKKKSGVNIMQ
mmetsp:Transcript_10788/g.26447  ORF Transcript_10788/g.26447 Transcript_10788/m.26447 type:complete len:200 (+) Transcript_10788:1231-1830(+)